MRTQLTFKKKDTQGMESAGSARALAGQPGPRVLLVDTNRWSLTARLAAALRGVGCNLAVVCPTPGHPVTRVRGIEHIYRYAGRHPLQSLAKAIGEFDPEIVIPFCDRSVLHLHDLHASASSTDILGYRTKALIERSLGPADTFSVVSSRFKLMQLAVSENIRVPETVLVSSAEDLYGWGGGFPWLLKADGTWGGHGVREVNNPAAAGQALAELTSHASLYQLTKQLVLNRDRDRTIANWRRPRPGVIAQSFIDGRPANCSVVAWQGEILAAIAVEVIRADGPCQPASIVQVVAGEEMLNAARRITRRLKLSGFVGLDFMIEHSTGDHYLIEMNPRCTPPSSVPLGEGRDLVAAISAVLTNSQINHRPPLTEKKKLAYFPQIFFTASDMCEIPELESACLDVPNEEPELVQELLHPWSERSLAGRILDHMRKPFSGKTPNCVCTFKCSEPDRDLHEPSSASSEIFEDVGMTQPGNATGAKVVAFSSNRQD